MPAIKSINDASGHSQVELVYNLFVRISNETNLESSNWFNSKNNDSVNQTISSVSGKKCEFPDYPYLLSKNITKLNREKCDKIQPFLTFIDN